MRMVRLVAGFLILMTAVCIADGVKGIDGSGQEREPKDVEKEKREDNREDFRSLKLVDSVGWLKITAFRSPNESMDKLERERQQRKIAGLIDFCRENRFSKKAEVDSLIEMTVEERSFCEERLKLVNPMLP